MSTKALRANMTEEEKQRQRERDRKRWANRTEEQKQRRSAQKREWRANWTEEQKERDKAKKREQHANMTEEKKQQKKERAAKVRANWTEERKQHRSKVRREWWANMTEEQKEQELRKRGFRNAKFRAKKKGLPFNLTLDHVKEIWPDDNKCRVFGIPFVRDANWAASPSSPAIDRIEPAKGYTIGNIQVISRRANNIKSDATAAEVMIVAQYLLKKERERAST